MYKGVLKEKSEQIQEIQIEDSQKKQQQDQHAPNIGTSQHLNNLQMKELQKNMKNMKIMNLHQVQDEKMMGRVCGGTLLCVSIVLLIFNLSFIIPDLIYASENEPCVSTFVDGFTFNLSTWLKVDAALRIVVCGSLFLVGIAACIKISLGYAALCIVLVFIVLYTIFQLIWLIVGSVLFWGKLNPLGICTGGVQSYMFANLIINLLGSYGNCLSVFSLKGAVDAAKLLQEPQ